MGENNPPAPPPIPPHTARDAGPQSSRPLLQLNQISGATGMTVEQLQQAVAEGGRLVVFQFCISVLILTFKRSSPITLIPAKRGLISAGAPYSLISLLVGWWGIPWGPIWTISTIATNMGGGKDVTKEVLLALHLPPPLPPRAVRVSQIGSPTAAERKENKSFSVRIVVAVVVLVFLWAGFVAYKIYTVGAKSQSHSTRSYFRDADNHLGPGGSYAIGNTEQAAQIAITMSKAMAVMRNANFEQSSKKSLFDMADKFETFCQLTGGKCVFLIHVPELRRFTPKAKAELGREAWWTAELLLDKSQIGKPGMQVAVGLKGMIYYDRVITGSFVSGATNETVGIENVLEGQGCERELYGWFDEPNSDSDHSSVSNAGALNQSQHH